MRLLIQPGDGVTPLVKAIDKAKKSVEIVVFRFDQLEVQRALENAVKRGVFVHALIAYTNRGGEKNLRKLEMRLLKAGVTVARTAEDLVRYHGKMMIVDRQELFLLAFNFTHLDIEHSRSFAIVTKNRELVQEALKLFECDTKRQTYTPGSAKFLVSPANARKELASFLKGARKELLVYDMKITDRAMLRTLEERAKAGVAVKVIGRLARKTSLLPARKLEELRLHVRAIVRDRRQMFIGSQSLRDLELDARREIGVVVRDRKVINSVIKIFKQDWKSGKITQAGEETALPHVLEVAKQTARAISKKLPPVTPVVEDALRKTARANGSELEVDSKVVEESVKQAVHEAVKQAVSNVMEDVVEQE